MNKWIILGIFIVLAVLFGNYHFVNQGEEPEKVPFTGDSTAYFSEDAQVMYFYGDNCHWCNEQSKVLAELAREGYSVKPMNIGEHNEYISVYDIQGTPTFIGPDGATKVGYQGKELLKKFMDNY